MVKLVRKESKKRICEMGGSIIHQSELTSSLRASLSVFPYYVMLELGKLSATTLAKIKGEYYKTGYFRFMTNLPNIQNMESPQTDGSKNDMCLKFSTFLINVQTQLSSSISDLYEYFGNTDSLHNGYFVRIDYMFTDSSPNRLLFLAEYNPNEHTFTANCPTADSVNKSITPKGLSAKAIVRTRELSDWLLKRGIYDITRFREVLL